MTMPYAEVIGDPIAQSKSPLIHRYWLVKLGMEGDYRATLVHPDDLKDFLRTRRGDPQWRGCNVTMPHKQTVMPYLDGFDPSARDVGAVNAVRPEPGGCIGYNTDVDGVLEALPERCFDREPRICVIGAGGAARAVLAACRIRGVSSLMFNVRTAQKAERLLEEWGFEGSIGRIDDLEHLRTADIIINASSLGMVGQQPMPREVIEAVEAAGDHVVLFDMITAPAETALLAAARVRGLLAVDGLTMLVGQAGRAFELFFGAAAPRHADAELRTLLTS